jgi:hypothetical protein
VKFRQHRGGLAESMQTVVEIKDRAALVAYAFKLLAPFYFREEDVAAGLNVEPYGCQAGGPPMYDKRTGWHTYIVTLKGYGVLGFTDGPCPSDANESTARRREPRE